MWPDDLIFMIKVQGNQDEQTKGTRKPLPIRGSEFSLLDYFTIL